MATKKLVIELEFDEEQDEYDEDYTFLEFKAMRIREDLTDLTPEERNTLSEGWGQSDWYSVGLVNSIITMLYANREIKADEVRTY